jgi:hypothetical protein
MGVTVVSDTIATAMQRHFFVIGAQRSGTTFLRNVLEGHPEIAMAEPVRPEPKHFLAPESAQTTPEEYRQKWHRGRTEPVLGEKSTSYLDHPEAAGRILTVFPESRFIVCLRNPVDRALSHYRFSVEHGSESLSAELALTAEAENRPWDESRTSVSPYWYIRRGDYASQLRPWMERVPRVHVVIFERMIEGGDELRRVFDHLGVDPDYEPPPTGRVNASSDPREPVPVSIRRRLLERYSGPNSALEELVGLAIPEWRR